MVAVATVRALGCSVCCACVTHDASQGRTVGQFIRDEINAPLGVEVFLGVPDDKRSRLAPMYGWPPQFMLANVIPHALLPRSLTKLLFGEPQPGWPRLGALRDYDVAVLVRGERHCVDCVGPVLVLPSHGMRPLSRLRPQRAVLFQRSSITARSLTCIKGAPEAIPDVAASRLFHMTEMPSANGVMSSAGMARIGAVLANGGSAFGVDLLTRVSQPTCAGARERGSLRVSRLLRPAGWVVGSSSYRRQHL